MLVIEAGAMRSAGSAGPWVAIIAERKDRGRAGIPNVGAHLQARGGATGCGAWRPRRVRRRQMIQDIAALARAEELDELERRLTALEERYQRPEQHTPPVGA